jgi:two-component system, LytTR family, sensor kinase
MKKILLCNLLSLITTYAFGQFNLNDYSTSYTGDRMTNDPMFIVAIPNRGLYTDRFAVEEGSESLNRQNPVMLSLEKDSIKTSIFYTTDSSEVHFFISGIYKRNAHLYEFRVLENKEKVVVPWSPITQFADDTIQINDFEKSMAYIGGYKTTLGNGLFLEIREKSNQKSMSNIFVFWAQIKPAILDIYTSKEFNIYLSKVSQFYGNERLSPEDKQRWKSQYPIADIDTNTSLPKKLIVEAKEDNLIFFLKTDIFKRSALEYRIFRFGEIYQDWKFNDYDNNLIWLKNLTHGEYKLQMRLAIQRHNITEYPFKIKPEWYQTGRFQAILGVLTMIFLGFFVLLFFFIKQKIKRKRDIKEREKIENELKSIRSQLNPHFVFNALSSIQGLMNKNELTQANYYLTEFSTLLRESLLSNEKEFVPLNTELKTLETYIKLEQLRFPFQYSISIDENLDKNAIELPYLLLQPLVENAIKHGVSNLYEKGKIDIHIFPKNKDLFVEIKDNGKGFNTVDVGNPETIGKDVNGFGLKLTKERVKLLTESNPYQTVSLLIKSNETDGTTALLGFKNWL